MAQLDRIALRVATQLGDMSIDARDHREQAQHLVRQAIVEAVHTLPDRELEPLLYDRKIYAREFDRRERAR